MASTSSSASAASDVVTSPPSTSDPPSTTTPIGLGETCSYLVVSSATGCREPRSCRSCLDSTGCMVGSSGKCVPLADGPDDSYDTAVADGLVVTEVNATTPRMNATQAWQFPSGKVRYCNSIDATCRACVRNNFWRERTAFPDSRFCLGDDGQCVCIDVCERQWYLQPDCSASGSTLTPISGYSSSDEDAYDRLWRAFLSVGIFVVITALFMAHRKRAVEMYEQARQREWRRQQEARRQQRASELGLHPLTLSGWESDRRERMDKARSQNLNNEELHETNVEVDSSPLETTAYARLEEDTTTEMRPARADTVEWIRRPQLPPLFVARGHRASV